MSTRDKRQTIPLRFPARGLVTAISPRDLPDGALQECDNFDLDQVRGRLRRRAGFRKDEGPTGARWPLDIFEYPVDFLPYQPPSTPKVLVTFSTLGGVGFTKAWMKPWWDGSSWDDSTWHDIGDIDRREWTLNGALPARFVGLAQNRALRIYPSVATSLATDAALAPIPPVIIFYDPEDEKRFVDDLGEGQLGVGFTVEDLRLLHPAGQVTLALSSSVPIGRGEPGSRAYWVGYLYDGYQHGGLSGPFSIESRSGTTPIDVTITVPYIADVPRRVSHVVVYAQAAFDATSGAPAAHEVGRVSLKEGRKAATSNIIVASHTANSASVLHTRQLVAMRTEPEKTSRDTELTHSAERWRYYLMTQRDGDSAAMGVATPILNNIRDYEETPEAGISVTPTLTLGERRDPRDPFVITSESKTWTVLKSDDSVDGVIEHRISWYADFPDRVVYTGDAAAKALSTIQDFDVLMFYWREEDSTLMVAGTVRQVNDIGDPGGRPFTEVLFAGPLRELRDGETFCSHTMICKAIDQANSAPMSGKSFITVAGEILTSYSETTDVITFDVQYNFTLIGSANHTEQWGTDGSTVIFTAGTGYTTSGISDVTGGELQINRRWTLSGSGASITFTDGFTDADLATLPTYEQNAQSFSTLPWASASVAVTVGNRTIVGNVRYPDPEAPLVRGLETAASADMLYSGYTGDGQAAPDFFDPTNLVRVRGGGAEIKALFEHYQRLGVLTDDACYLIVIGPGNAAAAPEERRFIGAGIVGRDTLADTPHGPTWMGSRGVYRLSGGAIQQPSVAIEDPSFRALIRDYGAGAWGAYDSRHDRYVLWFSLSDTSSLVYMLDASGAWTRYRAAFSVRSLRGLSSGELVAVYSPGVLNYRGIAVLDETQAQDLAEDPLPTNLVFARAVWPDLQPAGGDRLARITGATIEHGSAHGTETAVLMSVLLDGSREGRSGNFTGRAKAARGRVPISARTRTVTPVVTTTSHGAEIERIEIEFIPKARVRSIFTIGSS